MKRLIPLLLLVAAGWAYWHFNPPVKELVLTGIVTTDDVLVAPQIQGRIDKLFVKEGDTVEKGALIALLSPDELRQDRAFYDFTAAGAGVQVEEGEAALRLDEKQTNEAITRAQATLEATRARRSAVEAELTRSRLEYDRTEKMLAAGVGTSQMVEQARAVMAVAESQVASLAKQVEAEESAVSLARIGLDQMAVRRTQIAGSQKQQAAAMAQRSKADVRLTYTELRAPIKGIVDTCVLRQGEVAASGSAIVTLIDPDNLWVRADVEESYIERVRANDVMKVRLPSGEVRDGTVFYRGVDAGFATQRDVSRTKRDIKTFQIRLRVDNKDRRLAIGMTAYILLPVEPS